MKCPYCGADTQEGQRFCTACGGNLRAAAQAPKEKPKIDLSAYFDELPAEHPEPEKKKPTDELRAELRPEKPAEPVTAPRPTQKPAARQEEKKPAKKKQGSEKGLNIALMIALVLAVATVTFVLLLLFWPKEENPGAPRYDEGVQQGSVIEHPVQTETPAPTETPEPTPSPEPTVDPASEYLLPESNTRNLTEEDLSGLSHEELCLARNEIFARHGYIFHHTQIDAYFQSKSWNRGTVTGAEFKDSVLNSYELANISLIVNYENQHYGGSYY